MFMCYSGMPEVFKCGGIRIGREELQVLHDTTEQLNVLRWRDKREVLMLTTSDQPTMQETRGRWEGTPVKRKPSTVLAYNLGKCGVDTYDQLCSQFALERNTMKWYKKLFWRLVSMCIVNAHIVYKQVAGTVSHIMFHR